MLSTHHTISNFMPLKTKTGETISLLFMCFLAAMEKINSSCQYGDFHSRKSSLFLVSLRNGLYLKLFCKVTTILGCRGIKTLFLGKCYHVCPFTYFLMLCVYQERETMQQNSMQKLPLRLTSGDANGRLYVSPP